MQVALLVYKYFYYPSLLPHCIALLFEKISNIHQHQTRSLDNMSLFMHPGRLNARKNSLKINAPRIWNSIPSIISKKFAKVLAKNFKLTFLISEENFLSQ